jgi:predicted O-methyltransferase YrrM
MEACSETSGIAEENFKEAGLDNIHMMNGSFDSTLPELMKRSIIPGLVFIDGDHRSESVLKYFNKIAEISDSRTVIVLDDIHQSREMEDAWNQIKEHKSVTVTIDIFRMGLVFFRGGMNRFDYVIKY